MNKKILTIYLLALFSVFLISSKVIAETPQTPGAYLKISVIDEKGTGIDLNGRYLFTRITYDYDSPWQEYNDVDIRPLGKDGLIYLHPGPEQYNPTISIDILLNEDDRDKELGINSDVLVFKEHTYKNLINPKKEYAISYQFKMGSHDKIVLEKDEDNNFQYIWIIFAAVIILLILIIIKKKVNRF